MLGVRADRRRDIELDKDIKSPAPEGYRSNQASGAFVKTPAPLCPSAGLMTGG